MKGRRLTDSQISKGLRANLPDRAYPGLRERVLHAVETSGQQRALPSLMGTLSDADRVVRWRVVLLAAALLVAFVLAATAVFIGQQRPSLLVSLPSTPPETTRPTPSASASPSPTAVSLHLAWKQVPLDEHSPRLAWIGDQFVLADTDSGTVRTSTDGVTWQAMQPGDAASGYVDLASGSVASWQDQTVGWLNPEDGPDIPSRVPSNPRHVVTIARPPAAPISSTPFKGRIESIGIGPRGMVAEVHSALDIEAWVTKKLGLKTNNDWTQHVKSFTFQNGVLQIKLNNRPGLKVVWAEQGFEPGDIYDGGFGWYSPDGEHWTEMAPKDNSGSDFGSTLPTGGFGQVVGVSDGFIATGASPDGTCADPNGCDGAGIWYSADGLIWRFLGNDPGAGSLTPWMGGALTTGSFDLWTSAGRSRLPVAADLPAGTGKLGVGPLGLVTFMDRKALVSRDGIDLGISPIPAQMAEASRGRYQPPVAVGDRTVLVLERFDDGLHPVTWSLWLGTLEL